MSQGVNRVPGFQAQDLPTLNLALEELANHKLEVRYFDTIPVTTDLNLGEMGMYSDGDTIFRLYFKTHLGEFRRIGSLGDTGDPSAGDATIILDTDADTRINTEESSDEDIIRFDLGDSTLTAAREVLTIQAIDTTYVKIEPTTDDNVDLGATAKQFRDLYIDGKAYIDGIGENCLVDLDVKIMFGDADVYILSDDDGHLDLTADTSIDLNAPTQVVANEFSVDTDQRINFEGLAGDTYMIYNSGTSYLEVYLDGTKRLEL